ncbi:TRAP transporter permease [Oceanicella actignis]|uniref:TRAP transporter permease n=1 Tax=Oceanicella actignis TaxID=1189325 RepID=UPI0011E6FD13|nr:TRAP transporter fused permease subunit [Oceanicella actignis]TYO91349.1 TRAP transporter 4TM/12TM fusion protein [Oceanicella actignis]
MSKKQLLAEGGEPPPVESPAARAAIAALTLAGVALSIHQLFNLQLLGAVLIEGRYLYILGGIFLALAFLVFPLRRARGPGAVDWALFALALAGAGYFAWTAETSLEMGWEYAAPDAARWVSIAFYLLILEATRRAGGLTLFVIVAVISLYPTVADRIPDPLSGFASPFWDLAAYHMISSESSFGIPMRAFGNLVIGFIIFGAVLQKTGGGQFFNDLALALVGRFRGGAAKVAIFASGFMGSMSGSVISNVLTTGAVSIPAMKRTGFSARHAAATEACASTGGVLMPPIMGATAFVMASFLSRPYVEIALAAMIPSLLFYFGLFVQIDAYAARRGLRGLAPGEAPTLRAAAAEGWPYLLVFGVLIFLMVAWRMDTLAPFYATALLLIINQVMRRHRFTLRSLTDLVVGVGRSLAELTAVLLGVGLIVGAFSATGLAGTLVNELIFMAGDSTLALLAMGAVTAFVFGMGMTVTACYIFLAVVLAPALEQAGLNQLAVHLFILYWGMVSYITPPVALGAFAAATMAGAGPMRTGIEAMRLGGVIYVAPFFFVLNPALIGEAPAWEVAAALSAALAGIWLIGGALQGHVSLVGNLPGGPLGALWRAGVGLGGLLLALPGGAWIGLPHVVLAAAGLALAAPGLGLAAIGARRAGSPAA